VVPAVKVQQIVKNHTGFSGSKGLYTQTFRGGHEQGQPTTSCRPT
jgi:hypothetical protein